MSFQNPHDDVVREILSRSRRIAVVGCSPDPRRDSHRIARWLEENGHTVFPVNPVADFVLGRPAFRELGEVPPPVDVVDIFRRSEDVPRIVEEAVRVGARVVWMQLGVVHEEAARRALRAGLIVVMDRCPAIEHARLGMAQGNKE